MDTIDLTQSRTVQQNYRYCEAILEGLDRGTKAEVALALLLQRPNSSVEHALNFIESMQIAFIGKVKISKEEFKKMVNKIT